jgi:hypothetical protein
MNTTPTLTDIVDSLLNDRYDDDAPLIPDGTLDLSSVITKLSSLSHNGRAVWSDENYSLGQMLGRLLAAFTPENPTTEDHVEAILGLSILLARCLRTIPTLLPSMSIEEFLLAPADQDDLHALGRILACTPVVTVNGHQRINLAQLPVFHNPIPLTQDMIEGFLDRRIDILPDLDDYDPSTLLTFANPEDVPPPDDPDTFPLKGFENFFDAYLDDDTDSTNQ